MSIMIGQSGDIVRQLQTNLQTLGFYQGNSDGQFGKITRDAVVEFQKAYLVDGLVDTVTESAINKALAAWTNHLDKAPFKRPNSLDEILQIFGTILYKDADAGAIEITNDWEAVNIIRAALPIVGTQLVHKKLGKLFNDVLTNIYDKGLDYLIYSFGVWCPRHKMHDRTRPLSAHSWAVACDINAATNPPGKVGDIDKRLVDCFEQFGFEWGGRWKNRDDMHFQFCTGY